MKLLLAFGMPNTTSIVLLLLLFVLLFGAEKLPNLARALGKSLGEFKKAQREIEKELKLSDTAEKQPDETLEDKSETTDERK